MFIVFDIGGTNMRVAAASEQGVGEHVKVPTPKNRVEGIALLAELAHQVSASACAAAGGDIAGRVSKDGSLSDARNLRAWEGPQLIHDISAALHAPVRAYNDAIVVGLGEARVGAGRGFKKVAYVTVSTGVGGALVQEENLGASPLLGDVALHVGDLESQISGTAVQKKFGIHPKDLDSIEERNKMADILARGLEELTEIWSPEVFVIGGSMIVGKNPIPLERVEATLKSHIQASPAVRMASLGDTGGLEGGRALAALAQG